MQDRAGNLSQDENDPNFPLVVLDRHKIQGQVNSAREKLAGLQVAETAQWHQGQEPSPPHFAHSAEAGLQTKVLSQLQI